MDSSQDGHYYGNVALCADTHAHLGNSYHNYYYTARTSTADNYETLLRSLSFTGMHTRLRNVEMALPGTCEWLRSHQSFVSWTDHSKINEHHGLLWIRGKPGSGKSTIMKENLEWAKREWSDHVVLSYFFNARSSVVLHKSCLGLYRSLTHQLLSASSNLRSLFLAEFETKVGDSSVEPWTAIELQNFLLKTLRSRYIPRLTVFIDALDEGHYDDTWRMVDFFQKATEISMSTGSIVRLCLASRHYPHIHTDTGLSLTLEDQAGHVDDIALYTEYTLPGKDNNNICDIRSTLLSRADGIFLWVVLTISLLRPLYSQGRIEQLKEQLNALPADLYNLFATMLAVDLENADECVTLLQWMLVSKGSLSATELCLALRFRYRDPGLDLTELEASNNTATALRRILDYSRGLVEPARGSSGCMQLIHESVRQFLTSVGWENERVRHAWSTKFDFNTESCHAAVAETCLNFLLHLCRKAPFDTYWYTECPLAPYASTHWFRHLRQVHGVQSKRLFDLANEIFGNKQILTGWAQIFNIDMMVYDPDPFFRTRKLYPAVYYAARIDLVPLFTESLLHSADLNTQGGYFGTALQAACFHGSYKIAQILMDHGADPNVSGGDFGFALQAACAQGYTEVVTLLLQYGAHVNAQGGRYFSALVAASNLGHVDIVNELLKYGARTRVVGGKYNSALCVAASHGHIDVVRILLAAGSDVNEQKKPWWGSPLYIASKHGYEEVVQTLLEHGADINMQGGMLGTALLAATAECHVGIVRRLLDKGARYDSPRRQQSRGSKESHATNLTPSRFR